MFHVATVDNTSFRGITGIVRSLEVTGAGNAITSDADNQFIEEYADSFVDFTDTNPFGTF